MNMTHVRKYIRRLAILSMAIVTCMPAYTAGNNRHPEVQLIVKPSLCLIETSNGNKGKCESMFDVTWRSNQAISSCLYLDYITNAIDCWNEQRNGKLTISIEKDESVLVTLENRTYQVTYAQSKIRVMNKASLTKKRYRNPWDFL